MYVYIIIFNLHKTTIHKYTQSMLKLIKNNYFFINHSFIEMLKMKNYIKNIRLNLVYKNIMKLMSWTKIVSKNNIHFDEQKKIWVK